MELTQEQLEFMNGNLLGDGCLPVPRSRTSNTLFSFSQVERRSEYVDGLAGIYYPFVKKCYTIRQFNPKLGGSYFYRRAFRTVTDPVFTELRKKWYKEPCEKRSLKVVPEDLVLTWRTVALWSCDDGSNVCKQRIFRLSTHCFQMCDIELLLDRLSTNLDVVGKVYFERKLPVITLLGKNAEKFILGIKPYVPWNCLQYKLQWRPSFNPNTSGVVGVSKVGKFWQANIMKNGIRKLKRFKQKQDAIIQRKQWEKEMI